MRNTGNRIIAALAAVAVAALWTTGALAAGNAAPQGLKKEEVSIPFVQYRSIRDWQANKDEGLWIQDLRRNWYYAEVMQPCIGLDWAWSIGFDTRFGSSLDKFSSIIVPREGRCQITSLTRSDAPPKKKRGKAKAEVEASAAI
jgi:hypothetical protein